MQVRCLVLGDTVGPLGAVLGAVGWIFGCYSGVCFGCCQGCAKKARVLEGKTTDNEREHEVAALVCCRCVLKAEMVSGVYAGVFLCM